MEKLFCRWLILVNHALGANFKRRLYAFIAIRENKILEKISEFTVPLSPLKRQSWLLTCGHLLGKGWPIGSCLWCLFVFLSLSHVVSWVWCGTWLYRFLIFATFFYFVINDKFCDIFPFRDIWYYISWLQSASRRFSWSVMLNLLCLKKHKHLKCHLLQIMGGALSLTCCIDHCL